jgi:hypothetical protein
MIIDPPMSYVEDDAPVRAQPRGRIGASSIYAIFVCWTLFSVFVYSRFSKLGDAQAYMAGMYDDTSQARTQLITLLATKLIALLHVDVLAHLAFSLFSASGVAYLASEAQVRGRYRWPLLAIVLLPNFGVWASVVGRESLFIGLLGFFMGAVAGHARKRGFGRFLLALTALAGMVFVRAPFGMGMGLFFLMYLAYARGPRMHLSLGVQALGLATVGAFAMYLAWPTLDWYIGHEVLPRAQTYFTMDSATTRLWVDIDTTGELFKNLWWALPLSLVGPTPGEVASRPVMLPFFLSGLTVVAVLLHATWTALTAPRGMVRKILLLGWLPALAFVLVSYVPFGIYNPGSGIRYASCFLLFLILPSMLVSAVTADDDAHGHAPDLDEPG